MKWEVLVEMWLHLAWWINIKRKAEGSKTRSGLLSSELQILAQLFE